jgi:hypothetical protein
MNWKLWFNRIALVLLCVQLFNVGIYQQIWVQWYTEHSCEQDPIEDIVELIAEHVLQIDNFDHHKYFGQDTEERGYQLVEMIDILELFHPDPHDCLTAPIAPHVFVFNYHSFQEDAKSHIQAVVPPPPEC